VSGRRSDRANGIYEGNHRHHVGCSDHARVVGNLPDDGLGLLLPPVALSRSVGS